MANSTDTSSNNSTVNSTDADGPTFLVAESESWGYVNVQSRLFGSARLRQLRVAARPCSELAHTPAIAKNWSCYARIGGANTLSRSSFFGASIDGSAIEYRFAEVPRIAPRGDTIPKTTYLAWVRDEYPDDGAYTVDLEMERTAAAEQLARLELDGWLNMETRLLQVDFTLLNVQINSLCTVSLSFEHLESGGVMPSARLRTFWLDASHGDAAPGRFLEVAILTIVAIYIIQELYEIYVAMMDESESNELALLSYRSKIMGHFGKYLATASNYIDWCTIILSLVAILARFDLADELARIEWEIAPFSAQRHYNLHRAADLASLAESLLAANAVLVYLRTFKYLSEVPFLSTIMEVANAGKESLIFFVAIFVSLMTAFATTFVLAFGKSISRYKTIGDALLGLFRFVNGDLDLFALMRVQPVLGTLLPILFIFFSLIGLIFMFVVIVVRAFEQMCNQKVVGEAMVREFASRISLRCRNLSTAVLPPWLIAAVRDFCAAVFLDEERSLARAAARRKSNGSATAADGEGGDPFERMDGDMRRKAEGMALANGARRAGDQLKKVALALGDAQAQQFKAIDEIRTLVHAQQRETEALLEAMADKGLRAEAGGLVRRLVPERVDDGWWEDHKRTVSRRAWT